MNQKKSVLTIGGATQDIYVRFHGADSMKIMRSTGELNYMLFESGAKVEVEDLLNFTGGGSTNSATTFARQNFDTTCFCMLGNDVAGNAVLSELEEEQIKTDCIVKPEEHPTAQSFVVNSVKGERTIFAHRGANRFLKKEFVPFERIKNVDQIYITSLSNESAELLPEIVAFAKEHKKPVAINPGVSQLSHGALALRDSLKNIDTLILNSSEARTFMVALVEKEETYKSLFASKEEKTTCSTLKKAHLLNQPMMYENLSFDIKNFFAEIFKIGPEIVVVTDGSNGVYVATSERVLFHESFKVDVVDSLGAGDAFGSCFIASLARGETIENSLKNGIVNAASVIQQLGAKPGILTLEELAVQAKKLSGDLLTEF